MDTYGQFKLISVKVPFSLTDLDSEDLHRCYHMLKEYLPVEYNYEDVMPRKYSLESLYKEASLDRDCPISIRIWSWTWNEETYHIYDMTHWRGDNESGVLYLSVSGSDECSQVGYIEDMLAYLDDTHVFSAGIPAYNLIRLLNKNEETEDPALDDFLDNFYPSLMEGADIDNTAYSEYYSTLGYTLSRERPSDEEF